ncbi:unnamed protein product, partial [Amoebophrya sp. A25]
KISTSRTASFSSSSTSCKAGITVEYLCEEEERQRRRDRQYWFQDEDKMKKMTCSENINRRRGKNYGGEQEGVVNEQEDENDPACSSSTRAKAGKTTSCTFGDPGASSSTRARAVTTSAVTFGKTNTVVTSRSRPSSATPAAVKRARTTRSAGNATGSSGSVGKSVSMMSTSSPRAGGRNSTSTTSSAGRRARNPVLLTGDDVDERCDYGMSDGDQEDQLAQPRRTSVGNKGSIIMVTTTGFKKQIRSFGGAGAGGVTTSLKKNNNYREPKVEDLVGPEYFSGSFLLSAEKRCLVKREGLRATLPKHFVDRTQLTLSDLLSDLFCALDLSDFDRGEVLDLLIKFDERRLQQQQNPVTSPFGYGRFVLFLLMRLDVSSNFRHHEQRTPLRTHMLKLLLQLLRGNSRGRVLFHLGEGTRVLCTLIKGNGFGFASVPEMDERDDMDRAEEDDLYKTYKTLYPSQLPQGCWSYTQNFDYTHYYTADFLDDKFYGSRDRMLSTAVLETLGELWGPGPLVEELMAFPYTVQCLSQARDAGNLCFLISELLS